MGGSSIGYLLREGARNIYANKQMSVAAIGVLVACMLLIGASIVFSFNANSFVGYVEAQNEVVVFLKDNLSDDRISEVEQQLKNTENVSAVRFISKEEGLDSWVQSMSGVAENSEELFAPLYEDNIMPDSFSVTIRDLSQLDATVQVLSDYDDVDYVRAPEQVAQTITIIKHAVNLGGAAIVLLLIGVASMIIANTIKLTVYNRRLEIYIMKSVGATRAFIRTPFVIEGVVLGLLSGLLSYGILYFVYDRLAGMLTFGGNMVQLLPFSSVWWIMLIGFLVAGVLTGMCGSAISMGKYLKEEGG